MKKLNKVLLRQDSRDLHVADHFGAVSNIPDTFELERNIANPIEPAGSVMCTAYAAVDVCENQTGLIYNQNILWAETPHGSSGATPQDSMGALIKNGLVKADGTRDIQWKSYFRSDGTSGDYFLTTQNSMLSTNSPTTVAMNWYEEWNMVAPDGIMPEGKTWVSGHDFEVTGWKMINNEPHFHVKAWQGYQMWMSKTIYNEEMNKYGTSAWIPTTLATAQKSQRTLIQWINDMLVNLGLGFQQLVLSGFPPSNVDTLLPWTTRANCSHNVRVIADQVGMSVYDKNVLWACVRQESNFDTQAIHVNHDGKGNVLSTDYGIAQINDYWHIGDGKDFPSVDYVMQNPEADMRWMAKCFQNGQQNLWCSFSSGDYKKWLPYVPIV